MASFDQTFPAPLRDLHNIEFDDGEGEGIDFEPYQEFLSAEDTAEWFQTWTGGKGKGGSEFRIFGQDGSGGYAAFWLARPGKPVLEQPIVFFGSEGELGVVASRFTDYLWLLAAGLGPYEVVAYGVEEEDDEDDAIEGSAELIAFAKKHGGKKKTPAAIVEAAQEEFPDFETKYKGAAT
jgi:hypothetical protein